MYHSCETQGARVFRDTYYRVNDNLDRLKKEIDRNRSLKTAAYQKIGEYRSNPFKGMEENLANRNPPRFEPGFMTNTRHRRSDSLGSSQLREPFDAISTRNSHMRHGFPPGFERSVQREIERNRRYVSSAKRSPYENRERPASGFVSATVDALVDRDLRYPRHYENEKYTSIQEDIIDLKCKLTSFVNQLHVKEDLLKDELERLDRRPASTRAIQEIRDLETRSGHGSPRSPRGGSPKSEHYSDTGKKGDYGSTQRNTNAVNGNSDGLFETRYGDVGGNSDFYASGVMGGSPGNVFLTSEDFINKTGTEFRLTAKEPIISTKKKACKRHSDSTANEYAERAKLRQNIFKAKLEATSKRLRNQASKRINQREHDIKHLDLRDMELRRRDYSATQKIRDPRSVTENRFLTNLKEDRVSQNHGLNLLKEKAEYVRNDELERQFKIPPFNKEDKDLGLRLSRYEYLIRENMELKNKLRKARKVLL